MKPTLTIATDNNTTANKLKAGDKFFDVDGDRCEVLGFAGTGDMVLRVKGAETLGTFSWGSLPKEEVTRITEDPQTLEQCQVGDIVGFEWGSTQGVLCVDRTQHFKILVQLGGQSDADFPIGDNSPITFLGHVSAS